LQPKGDEEKPFPQAPERQPLLPPFAVVFGTVNPKRLTEFAEIAIGEVVLIMS
jgi:hypothetical protein